MPKDDAFQEMLEKELDERIAEMEDDGYRYVARIEKSDVVGMLFCGAACVAILVCGIL